MLNLGQPEGAVLFNLEAFTTGSSAVLERIPSDESGIYAWFRAFRFRADPDAFADDLIDAINSPKFQPRTGDVAPYYQIAIRSKSFISERKERSLRVALREPSFLSAMQFALDWSLLFQSPLYVGKSANLRARVAAHLRHGSPLRDRLRESGIDIDKTHLLLVPTPMPPDVTYSSFAETDFDPVGEDQEFSYEVLFEEVFSRLFNPSFSLRIG